MSPTLMKRQCTGRVAHLATFVAEKLLLRGLHLLGLLGLHKLGVLRLLQLLPAMLKPLPKC